MVAALLKRLEEGPLVVDGAMGTQFFERGVLYNACLEELNVSRSEIVRKIHEDYIRAGANVIETNTFGANAMRLEKHGLGGRVRELNQAAVKVARDATAVAKGDSFVVGAIGPTGYFLGEASPEDLAKVRAALTEQAEALCDSSVDAILVETMRQTNELEIAIASAVKAAKGRIPVIASASVDEHSRMADGTSSAEIARWR